MEEIWKQIVYDGILYDYEVNTVGKIRNIKTGTIKKPHDNGRGYLKVQLYHKGKGRSLFVHRIVAETFIPNPDNFNTVDHIDHNKHNNNVENLRWLSHKDNSDDGRVLMQRKIRCIELDKVYDSISQASRETKVSIGGICDCCRGKLESIKGLHFEYVAAEKGGE